MAFVAISSLSTTPFNISTSSPYHFPSQHRPFRIICHLGIERRDQCHDGYKDGYKMEHSKPISWTRFVSTALAAANVSFSCSLPVAVDLNKFEADIHGEFGIGSAAQFGSTNLRKAIHVNENFK